MPKRQAKKTLLIDGTWHFGRLPDKSAMSVVVTTWLFRSACSSKLVDVHSDEDMWHIHVQYELPPGASPQEALYQQINETADQLKEFFPDIYHQFENVS